MKLNMAVTHPSPGMRSHWPVIPAMRLLWTIMTPLGRPVEPLVYMTTARSDGWGFTIPLCTVGDKNRYSNVLRLQILLSWLWNSIVVKKRITYYSQVAGQALAHPACCGWTVLLGSLLCSLSSGPHRSHASILESVTAHSEQRPTNEHIVTTHVEDHVVCSRRLLTLSLVSSSSELVTRCVTPVSFSPYAIASSPRVA